LVKTHAPNHAEIHRQSIDRRPAQSQATKKKGVAAKRWRSFPTLVAYQCIVMKIKAVDDKNAAHDFSGAFF
jgi:hypothetical protein